MAFIISIEDLLFVSFVTCTKILVIPLSRCIELVGYVELIQPVIPHNISLINSKKVFCSLSDDMIEHKSGSSTPQRSGSTAGLHRPRLSIDSATVAVEMPQLSSSLPGSLTGSTPLLAPRQGSHTMDFFEMCASLITALAR